MLYKANETFSKNIDTITKPANPQLGIVLAGGGAKGAYQAGALRYLAELGVKPHIIAGTSIGTLNGAVLASGGSFAGGVERLNALWDNLGQEKILLPNTSAALKVGIYATKTFLSTFQHWLFNFLLELGFPQDNNAIFDPKPIERFLRKAVNPASLRCGIELWVTVFPSLKIPGLDYDLLIDLVRSCTGTKAQWLCAQDIPNDETLYNLLLASAAIPLAFPQREVNGRYYVDGALGDNIPLGALAERGCTHVIVIHLDNGEPWNRYDFPQQTIIEIRPEQRINKSNTLLIGSITSLLDFSAERITELKRRGYQDAKRCLEPIIQTFRTTQDQRQSHDMLVDSTKELLNEQPL